MFSPSFLDEAVMHIFIPFMDAPVTRVPLGERLDRVRVSSW